MKLSREEVRPLGASGPPGTERRGSGEAQSEQLSNILENFEILQKVDTTGVEPTAHCIALENVLRDDVPASSLPADRVLANAPDREENYLKVRAVLEQ